MAKVGLSYTADGNAASTRGGAWNRETPHDLHDGPTGTSFNCISNLLETVSFFFLLFYCNSCI
jgi:hypothetical protein